MNTQSLSFHLLGYLDGGTGSMLIQATIAGVLTAAYAVMSYWARLKAKFKAVFVRAESRNP